MKAKYIKLLCLIAVVMFASCGKATYITSDKDAVCVDIKGEKGKVKFDSDGDLELVYAPEWINAKLRGKTLKYNVKANETDELRRDIVVVKSDDKSLTLVFTQPTTAPSFLILPKTRAVISKEGVGTPIKVLTDGAEINVECPEEITYEYSNGELTFNSNGHSGKGKNYTAKVICGEFSQKVTILQKGDICATCGGRGRITCKTCGGNGYLFFPYRECNKCWTKGTVRCPSCGGTGK